MSGAGRRQRRLEPCGLEKDMFASRLGTGVCSASGAAARLRRCVSRSCALWGSGRRCSAGRQHGTLREALTQATRPDRRCLDYRRSEAAQHGCRKARAWTSRCPPLAPRTTSASTGLIRTWAVTDAARQTDHVISKANTGSDIWGDRATVHVQEASAQARILS